MGHESVVYGAIIVPSWKDADPGRLLTHNQTVIAALPESDDWPFLTRPMFAFSGISVRTGHYASFVIHFGATFKAVEWEWAEWLAKFEHLLAHLFWYDAYLHLHTEGTVGDYEYHYGAEATTERFYKSEPPVPADHWTLSGGPRSFTTSATDPQASFVTEWVYLQGAWQPRPPQGSPR
jgi:hypothetical protein